MGRIIARNAKLYLRYYDKISGKKIDKTLGLPNIREGLRQAKEQKKLFEANLLDKYYSLKTLIKNRMTIDEAAELFSEIKKHSKGTIKTIRLAKTHLINATNKKYIADYDRLDFMKFSKYLSSLENDGKKLSQNSKSIYSRTLKSMFNWLKDANLVKHNYVVVEKSENKQIETIPLDDFERIKKFLFETNKNGYFFIRLLELTGLRRSSAIALLWEQIDFENKNICIENVKKDRKFIFPLTDEIISLLKEMGHKETGKVFAYSKDGLKFWYRVLDKLGIKKYYGLHQIRKTFISKLANSGVSLYDVATLADHRSIQTTYKFYAKNNIERLRNVLNEKSSPQTSPQSTLEGRQIGQIGS